MCDLFYLCEHLILINAVNISSYIYRYKNHPKIKREKSKTYVSFVNVIIKIRAICILSYKHFAFKLFHFQLKKQNLQKT